VAKRTYAAIASLDGYVEVEEDRFGWATPDEDVQAFVNGLERPIGSLYGRLARGREGHVLPDAPDGIQRDDVMNPC
jgi:hypothetical protein